MKSRFIFMKIGEYGPSIYEYETLENMVYCSNTRVLVTLSHLKSTKSHLLTVFVHFVRGFISYTYNSPNSFVQEYARIPIKGWTFEETQKFIEKGGTTLCKASRGWQ